jgi:hypothetical protein
MWCLNCQGKRAEVRTVHEGLPMPFCSAVCSQAFCELLRIGVKRKGEEGPEDEPTAQRLVPAHQPNAPPFAMGSWAVLPLEIRLMILGRVPLFELWSRWQRIEGRTGPGGSGGTLRGMTPDQEAAFYQSYYEHIAVGVLQAPRPARLLMPSWQQQLRAYIETQDEYLVLEGHKLAYYTPTRTIAVPRILCVIGERKEEDRIIIHRPDMIANLMRLALSILPEEEEKQTLYLLIMAVNNRGASNTRSLFRLNDLLKFGTPNYQLLRNPFAQEKFFAFPSAELQRHPGDPAILPQLTLKADLRFNGKIDPHNPRFMEMLTIEKHTSPAGKWSVDGVGLRRWHQNRPGGELLVSPANGDALFARNVINNLVVVYVEPDFGIFPEMRATNPGLLVELFGIQSSRKLLYPERVASVDNNEFRLSLGYARALGTEPVSSGRLHSTLHGIRLNYYFLKQPQLLAQIPQFVFPRSVEAWKAYYQEYTKRYEALPVLPDYRGADGIAVNTLFLRHRHALVPHDDTLTLGLVLVPVAVGIEGEDDHHRISVALVELVPPNMQPRIERVNGQPSEHQPVGDYAPNQTVELDFSALDHHPSFTFGAEATVLQQAMERHYREFILRHLASILNRPLTLSERELPLHLSAMYTSIRGTLRVDMFWFPESNAHLALRRRANREGPFPTQKGGPDLIANQMIH